MLSLREHYKAHAVKILQDKHGYKNPMQLPYIKHVTLNMGVGEAVSDRKILTNAQKELSTIAGQHATVVKAKKSVAGFKIREGWPIGCKCTLRGPRMYDFLERLLHIALPRIRDFRGLDYKSFDGNGNYNLGITEQIIFPEIEYDKIDAIRGLDIAISTSAKTNDEGYTLLKAMCFPFKEKK